MTKLVLTGAALLGTLLSTELLAQVPAAAAATGRTPRASWTADRRDFAVGDVITVLLDEYTLASANQGNVSSDLRSRESSVSLGQSVTRAIPSVSADFGTQNDAESRQRGEATRQNRFQGEMTVRVTAVEPGGRLRIEGRKVVSVDKNREEILLKGFVRAQDVNAQNLIDSWRVGNAELVYSSKGSLTKPKGGILSKLVGALWP